MSGLNQVPLPSNAPAKSQSRPSSDGGSINKPNDPSKRIFVNFSALAKVCNSVVEEIVVHLYPNGSFIGKHWTIGDVKGSEAKKDGSMRITFDGKYRGWGRDFTTDSKNYNVLNMWALRYGISEREASLQLCDFIGLKPEMLSTKANLSPEELIEIQKTLQVKASDEVLKIAKAIKTNTTAAIGLATSKSAIERDENGNPLPPVRSRAAHPAYLAINRNRLKENKKAIEWLHARGLSEKAIKHFNLGMVGEFNDHTHERNITPFALKFPLIGQDGVFDHHYFYYNIPGVTENPIAQNGWGKSAPTAYFSTAKSGKQSYLMICEGFKDLWRTWEELNAMGIVEHFMLVTSSHGKNPAWQYYQKDFWQGYKAIFLAHDMDKAGASMAQEVANLAFEFGGKSCLRFPIVTRPDGKDMTDMFNSYKIGKEEFKQLMKESRLLPPKLIEHEHSESPQENVLSP